MSMTVPAAASGASGSDRISPGLVMALPYLLLVAAFLISWPWRALELPGLIGNLAPLAVVLLVLVVLGGIYATWRRLPQGLFTWLPVGLGAISWLATGVVARNADPGTQGIA